MFFTGGGHARCISDTRVLVVYTQANCRRDRHSDALRTWRVGNLGNGAASDRWTIVGTRGYWTGDNALPIALGLLRAANQLLHLGDFFRHAGRENLGSVLGDQDGVLDAEVHPLVGEFDVGFYGDDLAGFDGAFGPEDVVGREAHEVPGKSEPLFLFAVLGENGSARVRRLFISVARFQERDHSLLRLKVDGIPLRLLGRELAAD